MRDFYYNVRISFFLCSAHLCFLNKNALFLSFSSPFFFILSNFYPNPAHSPSLKMAYWIISKIAIAILNFSLLLHIYLSLFQLCDSKSCRFWPLCLIFVSVLDLCSWLIFHIALSIVFALPTIATAIVVALSRS